MQPNKKTTPFYMTWMFDETKRCTCVSLFCETLPYTCITQRKYLKYLIIQSNTHTLTTSTTCSGTSLGNKDPSRLVHTIPRLVVLANIVIDLVMVSGPHLFRQWWCLAQSQVCSSISVNQSVTVYRSHQPHLYLCKANVFIGTRILSSIWILL